MPSDKKLTVPPKRRKPLKRVVKKKAKKVASSKRVAPSKPAAPSRLVDDGWGNEDATMIATAPKRKVPIRRRPVKEELPDLDRYQDDFEDDSQTHDGDNALDLDGDDGYQTAVELDSGSDSGFDLDDDDDDDLEFGEEEPTSLPVMSSRSTSSPISYDDDDDDLSLEDDFEEADDDGDDDNAVEVGSFNSDGYDFDSTLTDAHFDGPLAIPIANMDTSDFPDEESNESVSIGGLTLDPSDGKALMADYPRLIDLDEDAFGKEYKIEESEILIGSSERSDLILPYGSIAANHAKIMQMKGKYIFCDLNSGNPTLVNNRPTQKTNLKSNDRILLGDRLLAFVAPGDLFDPDVNVAERGGNPLVKKVKERLNVLSYAGVGLLILVVLVIVVKFTTSLADSFDPAAFVRQETFTQITIEKETHGESPVRSYYTIKPDNDGDGFYDTRVDYAVGRTGDYFESAGDPEIIETLLSAIGDFKKSSFAHLKHKIKGLARMVPELQEGDLAKLRLDIYFENDQNVRVYYTYSNLWVIFLQTKKYSVASTLFSDIIQDTTGDLDNVRLRKEVEMKAASKKRRGRRKKKK